MLFQVGQVDLKQLQKKEQAVFTSNWLVKSDTGKKIVINMCNALISNPNDASTAASQDCDGAAVCVDGQPGGTHTFES